jgi:outer membrane protein assembly factor BamB
MQILKNKTMAIMIAVFLTISMSAAVMLEPGVQAHTPAWQFTTVAYIAAAPNPVGVGQQALIFVWLDYTCQGVSIDNNIRFRNYQLTITRPDNVNETITWPICTDPTSSAYTPYTPNQVGTYTLTFNFPGQTYDYGAAYPANAAYNNDTYTASSATMKLVVQQDPIPKLPATPYPTEYWARPINGANYDWENIASNWLGGAAITDIWQKNGAGPRSAHIMWTAPIEFGGMTGGGVNQMVGVNDTAISYYSGFSYNTRFGNPMIMNGILYYQTPNGEAGSGGGEFAVDLRTGAPIWSSDTLVPSKGQLYDFQTPNQHGVVGSILWVVSGTTWIGYNQFNMKPVFNLTSVPSGTEVYANDGSILRYIFSYSTTTKLGYIALWNESAAITNYSLLYAGAGWPNTGAVINASTSSSYSWNVTFSADLTGSSAPSVVGIIPGYAILGRSSNIGLSSLPNSNTNPWTMWAISDKPETRGQLMWIKNYAAPANNVTRMLATQPIDPVNHAWTMTDFETGQRLAYSIDTGDLLWGPLGDQPGFQYYSSREGLPAYGNLYVTGYGGTVFCFSMKDGTLLWTYGNGGSGNSTSSGDETPWGHYPTHAAAFADGVIYTMSGEHSPNTPLYKGNRARAIDAFTGQELWTLLDWSASGLGTSFAPVAIADGYMAFANAYDGRVYTVGKGPSQMTVSAPDTASSLGASVTIKGSVTDIAAGTKLPEQAARFPNGVPAVSDASQSAWMEYIYMQQTQPTNTTGVPVTLSVVDSNGNFRDIGTATSNDGFFSLNWKPDITGQYTVYASFTGSESYYPSHAVTSFSVDAAVATPTPSAQASFDSVTQSIQITVILAAVAIIIAIAIIGLLMLRKRV